MRAAACVSRRLRGSPPPVAYGQGTRASASDLAKDYYRLLPRAGPEGVTRAPYYRKNPAKRGFFAAGYIRKPMLYPLSYGGHFRESSYHARKAEQARADRARGLPS